MTKCDVLLVGFEDQENLGLRYISAYLSKHNVRVSIEPYQYRSRERILSRIRVSKPRIVGFSLIFQRLFSEFRDLISYLREKGVSAHLTIGGHFPSMECLKTLESIPGLDSVVRFEGEETLLELYGKLDDPGSWSGINGLAFRTDGSIRANPLRPLITDLDSLPFPIRDKRVATQRGLGICSVLGSRGCYHDCSFCSIHQFYGEPPGPLRRTRSPANVIAEMENLFYKRNIRIFIFQDDEWFMKGRHHIAWVEEFLLGLKRSSIHDRILWRISCRVDDIKETLIRKMQEVGLMCIYLGIESGNDRGLKTFNKHFFIDDVYSALDVLRGIRMPFEFGFMMFDPDSNFESILENVKFLEKITEQGQAVAHFSKMVPYAGTPISRRLENEQRLEGTIDSPNYGYYDPRLNVLELFASRTFNFRNFSPEGLVERLRLAKFDSIVLTKFFRDKFDAGAYEASVESLIQQSNDSALETMAIAANFIKNRTEKETYGQWPLLERLTEEELASEERIAASLDRLGSRFCPET